MSNEHGKQLTKHDLLLGKLQTTQGTEITGLAAADFMQCAKPVLALNPSKSNLNTVGGGYTHDPTIIGALEADVGASFPITVAGFWLTMLQCCGFKNTSGVYALSQKKTEHKDMTLWGYSGNLESGLSFLEKAANCMFSFTVTLDFEKGYATIDFKGKGAYTSAPTLATQPTVTRTNIIPLPLRSVTMVIMNDSGAAAPYVPYSLTFDVSNTIIVLPDGKTASGKGATLISDVKTTWKAKVAMDASNTPVNDLIAGTIAIISVKAGGVSANYVQIATSHAQIDDAKSGDQNGVKTWELGGPCVDNDLVITVG